MKRPALLVVYLAVFVDMLGFGIISQLLPFHAADLGGTGQWVGAVLTSHSAAQFVAAPVLGALLCLVAAATVGRRFRGPVRDSTELMGQVA